MSTLLESLLQREDAVYNNATVMEVIGQLNDIQESCSSLMNPIQYTVEMVPIVKLENCNGEGDEKYCVNCKDFKKLLGSSNMSISDAIGSLISQVEKDCGAKCEASDMAIVIPKEDSDELYKSITPDPTKINAKCEAIAKHVDFLKAIQETGCNILMN